MVIIMIGAYGYDYVYGLLLYTIIYSYGYGFLTKESRNNYMLYLFNKSDL